jgi:hypothetical protein
MSLFLLDEQLARANVVARLPKRLKVQRLKDLRPGEQLLDDRIPEVLCTLRQPTLLTIDRDFWDRRFCHPGYCILYFHLPDERRDQLPGLLRALPALEEFRTRARRMGKVARVGRAGVDFWAASQPDLQTVPWPRSRRKTR